MVPEDISIQKRETSHSFIFSVFKRRPTVFHDYTLVFVDIGKTEVLPLSECYFGCVSLPMGVLLGLITSVLVILFHLTFGRDEDFKIILLSYVWDQQIR